MIINSILFKLLAILTWFIFVNSHSVWGFEKTDKFYPKTSAKECETVDLKALAPVNVKEFFQKPRQMGEVGWCYAFSSADLISWKLNKPISAVHLAINYNENLNGFQIFVRRSIGKFVPYNREVLESGLSSEAMKVAKRIGVCPLSALSDSIPSVRDVSERLNKLIELRKALNQSASNQCARMTDDLASYFKGIDVKAISTVLLDINVKDSQSALSTLAERSCKSSLIAMPPDFDFSYADKNNENLVEVIDTTIAGKYPRPVSILIDDTSIDQSGSGLHYMTVMGRRFDEQTKQCLYVLRDNKGPSCAWTYRPKTKCEHGHVLLPEKDLFDLVSHVVYLKP